MRGQARTKRGAHDKKFPNMEISQLPFPQMEVAACRQNHESNPDNYLHWRFQSKTANIACDLDGSSGEGVAVCEVREHAYKRAVKPDCAQGWVNSFSLRQGRTVVVNCYADTIFQGALLVQDYGYPLTVGSITCVIDETTGVTCKDATTGHYFQAARQSYRGR